MTSFLRKAFGLGDEERYVGLYTEADGFFVYEPSLGKLLRDPAVLTSMAKAGIGFRDVRRLAFDYRRRMRLKMFPQNLIQERENLIQERGKREMGA